MSAFERVAIAYLRRYGYVVLTPDDLLERARIAARFQTCLDEARSTEPVTDEHRRQHAELVGRQRERDGR